MINQQINQKFINSGVLLLLDSPPQMEFGIDNTAWKIGQKFKGIKLIPYGVHFIHFSLEDQKHLFKISKFIYFKQKKRVHVLKWNKNAQDFLKVSQQQQNSYIHGVNSFYFDCYLGPYPQQRRQIWVQSSNYINQKVLEKLDPILTLSNIESEYPIAATEKINIQQQTIYEQFCQQNQQQKINEQSNKEHQDQSKKGIGKFQVLRGTVYYSEIPKKISDNLQHTTNINLDKTEILELMFTREYKNQKEMMLGELQYSFISFLLGENVQGFDQWKKIINLICFSQRGINHYTEFFMSFIIVIFNQMKQFPKDFFIDELSKGNFLVKCLRRLYEYQQIEQINKKFRNRIKKLRQLIQKNFDYYIEMEEDQDRPIVLQQNENYY